MPCCVADNELQAARIESLESELLGVQIDNCSLALVAANANRTKTQSDAEYSTLRTKCSHQQDKLIWAYDVMQNVFSKYKLFDEDMHSSSKGKCYCNYSRVKLCKSEST